MTIDTGSLGALIDDGYGVHLYCETRPCHHWVLLDLPALAEKYGRDAKLGKQLLPRMVCSVCGGKKLETRLVAPGTTVGF